MQHLLAILRSVKAEQLTLRMAEGASARLTVQLVCGKSGLVKTYDVACLAEPEILCANIDRRKLPVKVVVKPKELARMLANFHSGQVDVTFVSLPDTPLAAPLPPGVAVKRLRLLSFVDPAKAEPTGSQLTTRLAVDAGDEMVATYTHRGNALAEATVNLRDLRVMVAFCEAVEADLALWFEAPGAPLLCCPDFRSRITSYFQGHGQERSLDWDAELVLATMLDSNPTIFDAAEAQLQPLYVPPAASLRSQHAGSAPVGGVSVSLSQRSGSLAGAAAVPAALHSSPPRPMPALRGAARAFQPHWVPGGQAEEDCEESEGGWGGQQVRLRVPSFRGNAHDAALTRVLRAQAPDKRHKGADEGYFLDS